MHIVNRCLKNMLPSIWYQGSSPQGACPPVCNGTHWTGSSAAPGAIFPSQMCAEGTAGPRHGEGQAVSAKVLQDVQWTPTCSTLSLTTLTQGLLWNQGNRDHQRQPLLYLQSLTQPCLVTLALFFLKPFNAIEGKKNHTPKSSWSYISCSQSTQTRSHPKKTTITAITIELS